MATEEQNASDQLRDATWQWAGRAILMLVLLGLGYFGGYVQMGDAADLRMENKELQDTIVDLKNQRETTNTRMARETRDKEVCEKEVKALKKELTAAKAAAAPAAE